MKKYLGENKVDISKTKFNNFKKSDWIKLYIEMYGNIDGEHHKHWLLNEIIKISLDSEVLVKKACWENGHSEFRFDVIESESYNKWKKCNEDFVSQAVAP